MSKWFSNILPAIENFAKAKATKQAQDQIARQNAHPQLSALEDYGLQSVKDVGRALLSPIQYAGNALLPNIIPAETPEQQASAERGAAMGMLSTAPFSGGNIPSAGDAAMGAKMATKDTMDVAKAQPGGLQAGFIRAGEDLPLGTSLKRDLRTTKNPNFNVNKNPVTPNNITPPAEEPASATFTPEQIAKNKTNPIQQEKFGSNTSSSTPPPYQEPSVPYPHVKTEPMDISSTRANGNPITGGSPVRVNLRDQAGKNPYYLEDMNNAQDVIDRYVPGNTAIEVENNLPIKLTEETQRIQNIMGRDPKTFKMSDLEAKNETNMQANGIETASDSKSGTATKQLIDKLNQQLNAKNPNIAPIDQATGSQLMDYKKLLDDRLKSVYKKQDLGTSLTDTDRATLTLRRTIDDMLSSPETGYPEAKQALKRQSAMIDARQSVAKAANDQEAGMIKTANTPKQPVDYAGKILGPWAGNLPLIGLGEDAVNKVLNNSVGRKIVGGSLVAGGVAGGSAVLVNKYNQSTKGNAYSPDGSGTNSKINPHGNSIPPEVKSVPTSQDQITFDQNNHVGIFKPFDGINAIDKNQYQKGIDALNKKQQDIDQQINDNPLIMKTPAGIALQAQEDQIKTQRNTLDALNTKSRQLDDPYNQALGIQTFSNKASDDITDGWSNIALANGDLNKLATLQNGKYSKLASALKTLKDNTGIDVFSGGMSLPIVLSNLKQAVSTELMDKYYNQFQSQGGYSSTTTAPVSSKYLPPIGPRNNTPDQSLAPQTAATVNTPALKGSGLNLPPIQ